MKKVSIIVPVYNMEQYLKKCLESIENQTYKNIEVIIIDDGSTDLSKNICEKFLSGKYKKFKLITQKNGGVSKARNTGLSVATGEYIYFLDPDDYIHPKTIEIMIKSAIEKSADIVVTNFINVSSEKKDILYPNLNKKYSTLIAKKEDFYLQKISNHVCSKLYKSSLFIENNIIYPEGRVYEDIATTYKLIDKANIIIYIPVDVYYYLNRSDSISHTYSKKYIDDLIISYLEIDEYFKEKRTETTDYFELTILFTAYTRLKKSVDFNEKRNIENFIRDEFRKIINRIKLYQYFKAPMTIKLYLFKYNFIDILLKIRKSLSA